MNSKRDVAKQLLKRSRDKQDVKYCIDISIALSKLRISGLISTMLLGVRLFSGARYE